MVEQPQHCVPLVVLELAELRESPWSREVSIRGSESARTPCDACCHVRAARGEAGVKLALGGAHCPERAMGGWADRLEEMKASPAVQLGMLLVTYCSSGCSAGEGGQPMVPGEYRSPHRSNAL